MIAFNIEIVRIEKSTRIFYPTNEHFFLRRKIFEEIVEWTCRFIGDNFFTIR